MINRGIEVNGAVGSRIRAVRQARNQEDLAVVAKLFETTVERWTAIESGQNVLDQNELIAFCLRFGIRPDFILLGVAPALGDLVDRVEADPDHSDHPNHVFWHFRLLRQDARPTTH